MSDQAKEPQRHTPAHVVTLARELFPDVPVEAVIAMARETRQYRMARLPQTTARPKWATQRGHLRVVA